MKTENTYKYYILSFIEGGTVMVAELCAAKLLAPYFGTSIQVWSATIGITMGGLAGGYFLGSWRAKNGEIQNVKDLTFVLLFSCFWIGLLPLWVHRVLSGLIDLSLGSGCVLALLAFLFPVLLSLGCTSPLIINLINSNKENAGKTSGNVYGISTLGGILFTFLTGFWFLPYIGIKFTLILSGVLLFITTTVVLFKNLKSTFFQFIVIATGIIISSIYQPKVNPKFKILEESDGLLGNIKVIEHTSEDFTTVPKLGRGLVVNNTLQTYMDLETEGISVWEWAHYIPTIAGVKGENQNSLLLGLGGGTVYKQLKLMKHNVDVVEIDPRIKRIAQTYFDVPKNATIYIDDARHFMKVANKKYDIICYDAFLSESPPEHLLTKEGLSDALKILEDDGLMIINFFGFLNGDNGLAARSILKTIQYLGLKVILIPSPGNEEYRNLFFVVSRTMIPDLDTSIYIEPDRNPIKGWEKRIIYPQNVMTLDSYILTDEKPILSSLYRNAAEVWRKGYNEIYTKKMYIN